MHCFRWWAICVSIWMLLLGAGVSLASASGAERVPRVLLFDMGSAESPVAAGYLQVTPETLYSPDRGYGWERSPGGAFNDSRPVREEHSAWHPLHTGPVTDPVLRDGVEDEDALTFIVDLPPGQYWVSAVLGRYTQPRHDMWVKVNGTLVATNLDAWGHVWGSQGGTPMKSVAVIAEPTNGQERLTFGAAPPQPERWREYSFERPQGGNLWYLGPNKPSVLAVRIRPWVAPRLKVVAGKIEGDLPDESLKAARAAFEAGNIPQAFDLLTRFRPEATDLAVLKGSLLECLAGSMALQDPRLERDILRETIANWQSVLSTAGTNAQELRLLAGHRLEAAQRYKLALTYVNMLAYSSANRKTGVNNYHRFWTAYELCNPFTPEDPLFDKAHLLRGRVANWNGREGHWKNCFDLAAGHFAVLKAKYPEHPLVRLYTGERVPNPKSYAVADTNAPEWARLQHEALRRYLDLIHYWVQERQDENGELGGNWGDDVEILRGWAPAVLAIRDSVALKGITKMAEGVWHSGEVENGFCRTISDVEHGAELVSDTQPIMCAVDYGNPVYLERCMATMRCFRDVWTDVNSRGHRHFKAHHYSATAVSTNGAHAADVALNGRAVAPGLWLLWYSGHPTVKNLLGEWCRAWTEDAFRTDNGKPQGFVPGSIRFADDRLGGFAENWWETRDYFSDFESVGYTATLYHTMVGLYAASRDTFHMRVLDETLAAIERERKSPTTNAPQGSAAWAARICDSEAVADVMSKWRLITGEKRQDEFLKRRGSAYMRFLLNGDMGSLVQELKSIIDALSSNIELSTSEVLFTDRVALPGNEVLFEMMTGSAGEPSYYPVHAVTWENTEQKVAVLVERAGERELVAQVYSFADKPLPVIMRPWRLTPGKYRIERTELGSKGSVQEEVGTTIIVAERGERHALQVRPGILKRIKLVLVEAAKVTQDPRADFALGPDAIELVPGKPTVGQSCRVRLTVHNIGNAPGRPKGTLWQGKQRVGDFIWTTLEAPLDLQPRACTFETEMIPAIPGPQVLRLVVDPGNTIPELVELNNERELAFEVLPASEPNQQK